METKPEADMDKQAPVATIAQGGPGKLHARWLQAMLMTSAGYYMGAVLGFAFTLGPHPVLWPPNAILMGVLLLAPPAWWPLILLAALPAHIAAQIQHGVPLAMMLGWYFSSCSEALIGAAGVRLFLNQPLRFDSFRHVYAFLVSCVFVAPLLSSFIDIALVRLLGWAEGPYRYLWRSHFFAGMLGALVFVPVMLAWNTHGPRNTPILRNPQGMMRGAAQFNPFIVSMAFLTLAFLAIGIALHGQEPLLGSSAADTVLAIQLFFIGLGVPLFLLAAAMQERLRAQEAVHLKEESHAARFSLIFRLSPDAMQISSDVDGRILDVNRHWEELFGYRRAEVIGRTVRELDLYTDDNDRRAVQERGRNGTLREFALEMRHKSGAIRDVRLWGETIAAGDETCFITIMSDVSALKCAELRAQEQQAQLTYLARVAVLGKLSGALAHELNQPLTAILSNAQAAFRVVNKEPVDLDEVREILKDIGEEDKRAGEVIRRLRALYMKGEAELQALDLNEVVGETIDLARSDLITRKVNVETALKPNLGCVLGDRVQLQQVLLNLIINACDAMSGNPPNRRNISFTTEDRNGSVQLEIADCGRGIAPEASGQLFNAFFTTKAFGLGLGLSISRSIVEEHGGSIDGMNNTGGGATFRIVLPHHKGPA